MKEQIYIVGSTAHSLINFRLNLIKSLKENNSVTVLSQDFSKEIYKIFKKNKVNYAPYGLKTFFILNEVFSLLNIIKIFLTKKNIKVLSYTFRGNVYVGLASFFNKKLQHYPMITGLGGIFLSKNDSLLNFIIYFFFKYLLKVSLQRSKIIIYQNNYDKNFFKKHIIKKNFLIIPGSGVDLKVYKQKTFPKKITFMMISRIIKNKGIENFFNVSKKVYKTNNKIKFIFVGNYQKKFSLNENFLKLKNEHKYIKILNWKSTAKDLYKKCSVYILPSKREGMSRTILEAMSSSRPIITTNVPGCKETVKNGYNGFLVNYNDNDALFEAINKFIKKPYLIKKFGLNSRRRAVKIFDVNIVNKKIINLLKKNNKVD